MDFVVLVVVRSCSLLFFLLLFLLFVVVVVVVVLLLLLSRFHKLHKCKCLWQIGEVKMEKVYAIAVSFRFFVRNRGFCLSGPDPKMRPVFDFLGAIAIAVCLHERCVRK